MKKRLLTSAAVVTGALAVATLPAQAQDNTTLKVASFLPATHHIVEHGTQVWMDSVSGAVGDGVQFEFYPAEQAGKAAQLLDLMTVGALDVVEVPLGYYTERFPLFGIVEMPGLVDDPCKGAAAIRALASEGGPLYEGDIAPQNLHPLAFYIFPSYSTISREPIRSAEDFAGKKIRISGGAMELEVATLGGVAIKMSSPEILQSLSRGTIDGAMLTYLSSKQYDLQTAAKYATTGYSFGGAGVILMMSESRYQALSDEMKASVDAAGIAAEQAYCSFAVEGEAEAEAFLKEVGVEMHEFSAEERAALDAKLSSLSQNWAAQLDKIGKPGTEVLEAYKGAVAGN